MQDYEGWGRFFNPREWRAIFGDELATYPGASNFLYDLVFEGTGEAFSQLWSDLKWQVTSGVQIGWNDFLDKVIDMQKGVTDLTDTLPVERELMALRRADARARLNFESMNPGDEGLRLTREILSDFETPLANVNAAENLLEIMHDMEVFDGLVGTPEYSVLNPTKTSLKNVLKVFDDFTWERQMKNVPIDMKLIKKT